MSTEPNVATSFIIGVRDELLRSLGETFGVFSQQDVTASTVFANLLTKVVVATIIVLAVIGVYRGVRRLLRLVLERFTLPGDVVSPIITALRYTAMLIATLGVLTQFGVRGELLANVGVAAILAFAFYLAWLISSKLLSRTLQTQGLDRSLEQLVRNVLAVVLITFGLTTVLSQFGINVLSVITTLGVVGIAVGFAAQETLSNFIAGITLLVERPFRIGEWVEINGKTGRVDEITLRTTRLITRDNITVSIPNAAVASSDITNLSAGGPLRVQIPVGIAYKESAKEARDVMLPILEAHEKVMQGPGRKPQVWLKDLGDSSVNLILLYWVPPSDIATQPKISAEILEQCKEALDEAGIEIPFPHLQLFIDDAKGLAPVVRPFLERSA